MYLLYRFLWIAPFILFFAGYYGISSLIGSQTINTPSLVGKRLQDAVALLTPYQLNLRILSEVEDATLTEGTVITQRPLAGQKIRFYQSVGVTISRHPPYVVAPNIVGLSMKESLAKAESGRIRIRVYSLESSHPKDECIAQYPIPGTPLPDRSMFAYYSKGQTPLRIMPNTMGMSIYAVQEFFKAHNIRLIVHPTDAYGHLYNVVAQKPIAGSLLDISGNPVVQIYAQQNS